MKLSNPFIPSLVSASNPSRVRTTVIVTLAGQAALMAVLLIQGCKPSVQSEVTPPSDVTSSIIATNTNALVVQPLTSNTPSISTNASMSAPVATSAADVASSNATVALLMPPLEANAPTAGAAAAKGTYIVVSGDSFFKIAKANHITVRALKAANPDVEPHKLKVGQSLNMPDASEAEVAATGTSSAPEANAGTSASVAIPPSLAGATSSVYVVKSGDTLFRIARSQHISVKTLRSLNNLSTDKIVLGQKLKLSADVAVASSQS